MKIFLGGFFLFLCCAVAPTSSQAEGLGTRQADLVVVQPPPLHSFSDEERVLEVRVANVGDAESEPSMLVVYRLDPEAIETARAPLPALGPGTTHRINVILLEAAAGSHLLKLSVDPDGEIDEKDEINNEAILQWTVERGLDGWCCLRGGVYSSSELSCDRRHGDFQFARGDAERSCRNEAPPMGWCCSAQGAVFETGELSCRIAGGHLADRMDQAQDQCSAATVGDEGPFAAIDDRGPDKPGGRMIGLVGATKVSGADAKIRYAAAPWGGVWRSDDEGDTWYQLTRPQPAAGKKTAGGIEAYSIRDIAVSPTDANLVLVAGYDNVRRSQHSQSGVYRSTNGGITWKLVKQFKWANGAVAEVGQLRFAPDDPKLVYAAHGSGVSYSDDAGATWKTVAFKDADPIQIDNRVWHVAISPKEAGGKRRLYACGDGSVWYSEDGGQKWAKDSATILPAGHLHCRSPSMAVGTAAAVLEVEPGHPDHVYLAYRHLANGPRYFLDKRAPQGAKVLLPETDGVACGTNAELSKAHQQVFGQSSILHDCGEGSLWLGDFSKFDLKAASPSASWSQMQGPPVYFGGSTPSGRVYLQIHETKSGYLLFFSDRAHLHVTEGRPQADAWHRLDGYDVSATYRDSVKNPKVWGNRLRMHGDPHAIWLSKDFDMTFNSPTGGVAPYDKNKELKSCLGGKVSVANDGGVYGSDDCGKTWNAANSGPKTLILVNLAGLTATNSGPALYFGTVDNDDLHSRDGGATWKDVTGNCGDCDRWYFDAADPTQVYELGYPTRKGPYLRVYRSIVGGFPDVRKSGNAQLGLLPYPQPTFFDDFDTAQSRPVVLPLAKEAPVAGGVFVVIERMTNGSRRIVQANGPVNLPNMKKWNGAQIKQYWDSHGSAWKPVLSLPGAAANAKVLQVSGGQHYPVFFVGDGTRLWKSNAGSSSQAVPWQQIVPQPSGLGSAGATMARRFFVNPYDPDDLYIVDYDAVKRSDDGGATWVADSILDDLVTQKRQMPYHCWRHHCVINDLVFDRNNPKRRFALGSAGIFHSDDSLAWTRILDPAAVACRPVAGVYDRDGTLFDPALYVACHGRGVLKLHHVVKRIYPDILLARPPEIRRLYPNQDFIIEWWLLLKNAGGIDIDRETLISILLDGEFVRKEVAGPIAAGETAELRVFLEATRGPHELTVILDSADAIVESEEGNNSVTHGFDL